MAIVGGGPAGAIAGRVSSTLGLRTIVIESEPEPRWKPGEALAPACNPILDRLKLSKQFLAHPEIATRSDGVRSIWGSDSTTYRDGIGEPLGRGWIVNRVAFEKCLAADATASGVTWIWGARVTSVARTLQGWRLHRSRPTGGEIHALFVIDATGRPANISRRLGALQRRHQPSLASVLVGRHPHARTDFWINIESSADGWWYSSSGPEGLSIVMRFQDNFRPRPTREVLIRDFSKSFADTRLIQTVADLPSLHILREAVVSAGSVALSPLVGDGWLATGDAAVAFDPISSQGLSNALASGEAAAHAAHAWLRGESHSLATYSARMVGTYRNYRFALADHYQTETRWQDQPFWRKRHKKAAAA